MPVPFTIGDAADLVDVSIQKIWLKGSEKETRDFAEYYGVETGVEDYYLKDSSLSGLGYASRILENAVITSESPVQGYDKTYTQVFYGKILPFTKRMWKFGIKKRDLENITQELRAACNDLREALCAERLDNAFATSYTTSDDSGNYSVTTTGGDGVALISNAHTREDGGTNNNNRITDGTTVNMDFDYDGLKNAHRTAALIKNPKGKPMKINLDTLVVARGSANHFKALEILGAIKKNKIPESFDNDGSGVMAYRIVATPWLLTNTAYWFMLDSTKKNSMWGSLQYKESEPITLSNQPNIVFKTEEIQYKATMAFDMGHNDYRNIVGSKNTNAA